MEKVLLLGGPGNISRSTIEELLRKQEFEVGVFTLPESDTSGLENHVSFYRGNRDNVRQLKDAVEDFAPDIVIDYVCFRKEQAETTAEILCGRIKQYIFISTVDVYGYPLSHIPMREGDEKRMPNCEYAADKLKCEEFLQEYSRINDLPLTIVRPVYSFGPEFVLDFFSRGGGRDMVPRIRVGKPVLVPGGGNTLIHVSSAHNTGRMIAQFAGHYVSVGKVYNCGHPVAMTHDEYVQMFARVLEKEVKLVHIPLEYLLPSDQPEINEILPILSAFNLYFSIEAFCQEFPEFTWDFSLEEAAREYITYNDENHYFSDPGTDNFEDRIIKEWLVLTGQFHV